MKETGSVTDLIAQAKRGDPEAAQRLWERYFRRLVGLARKKLRGASCREADQEDVALGAFDSFFRGAEQGRFPRLHDRDDLWRLLFGIIRHKAYDVKRRESRGGLRGREVGESAIRPARPFAEGNPLEEFIDKEPAPDLAVEVANQLSHLLAQLGDGRLRQVALWKLEGLTNKELADRLGCVERTVERKLDVIRKVLSAHVS